MSFELPSKRVSAVARPRWSGAAFLVEAMLLLVFVMLSFAVLTQLFAASAERANASRALTDAVAAATSAAERFCADPASVEAEYAEGNLRIVCETESEEREGGTMYYATISVYSADAPVVADTADADDGSDASRSANAVSDSRAAASPAGSAVEPLYSIRTAKYESGA